MIKNDGSSDEKITARKKNVKNLREENMKKKQDDEQQKLELQKQLELREKQRREAYDKRIIEEKKELMRLKQGVIEESSLIPENEDETEISLSLWGKIKNFLYHNKWWLGLACFAVLLGGYLVHDILTKPRPDMIVLLIGKYPSIGEAEYLSDYVESFADDFNGDGKTEAEVYYIDYNSENDYANYVNGSDTKLTTEMQIADAVMVIADKKFTDMIEAENVFVDLSELFPDNEHIDKQFFYLKDTDFAKHVCAAKSDIHDDTYIAVRAPKRLLYADADDMQKTYDKDMPVIRKIIEDLSK